MKRAWIPAVLLSLALAAGCGGNNETPTENAAPPAPADQQAQPPAEDARPPADRQARPPAGQQARPPAAPSEKSEGTASRPAAPAPERRESEFRELTLAEGTALPLALETPLSSETAQVETPVRARVRQSVIVDGVVAIPEGSTLTGTVTQVQRAGRVKGRAQLAFTFNRLEAPGGISEDVSTAPLTFVAEATKGEDMTKIGAGAIGGAIVGGIIGGGEGAAKGAAIGGAAGTGVVLATRGAEVTLEKGTTLAASLARPLTIRVQTR